MIALDDIRDAFTDAVRPTETTRTAIVSCENSMPLCAWNRVCKLFSRHQSMFESTERCTIQLELSELEMLFAVY